MKPIAEGDSYLAPCIQRGSAYSHHSKPPSTRLHSVCNPSLVGGLDEGSLRGVLYFRNAQVACTLITYDSMSPQRREY